LIDARFVAIIIGIKQGWRGCMLKLKKWAILA